jgi:hypothetical protein
MRAAAEIIGVAAVVVSLIFVGLELQQTTAAVRAASYQSISAATLEALQIRIEHPEVVEALDAWLAGTATDTQRTAAEDWAYLVLRHFENIYHQTELGMVDQEEVTRRLSSVEFLQSPQVREWWSGARAGFAPAFASEVDAFLGP